MTVRETCEQKYTHFPDKKKILGTPAALVVAYFDGLTVDDLLDSLEVYIVSREYLTSLDQQATRAMCAASFTSGDLETAEFVHQTILIPATQPDDRIFTDMIHELVHCAQHLLWHPRDSFNVPKAEAHAYATELAISRKIGISNQNAERQVKNFAMQQIQQQN